MTRDRVLVAKFGGSVLDRDDCWLPIADEIGRWVRDEWKVIAVVSARAGRTNALRQECHGRMGASDSRARAALISLGELESTARLHVELESRGVNSTSLRAEAFGLLAEGSAEDAIPVAVDVELLRSNLLAHDVIVVPGFTAMLCSGATVTLGRGGSDLTAFFLAAALGADRCRLVKDVPALFESDPNVPGNDPRRYLRASYRNALATDGSIVQHKAVRFAQEQSLQFELGRIGTDTGSIVGAVAPRFEEVRHVG